MTGQLLYQTTIKKEFTFSGVGLHSGKEMSVRVLPAEAGTGLCLSRKDVLLCPFVRATPFNVTSTQLATTITCGDLPISTIEHLVSALSGLGVDNAFIEVEGPEIPILDGSASPIAALVVNSGIETQKAKRKYLKIKRPVEIDIDGKFVKGSPAEVFGVTFEIDYPHEAIKYQKRSFEMTPALYIQTVANSRTFGFKKDVEMLWSMGLAKGGSMDNAIVLDDSSDDILNPEGLRHKDEFVNHKILDLMGDIALIGHRIIGSVHAARSGHHVNNLFARRLIESMNAYSLVELEDGEIGYGYIK